MSTKARLTKGTLLKRGTGSPPSYSTIAEVTAVGDFGQESALLDVTHLESTALEYILSLPDGAEMSTECNWIATATDPTSVHEDMIADQSAGVAVPFQIVLPGGEGTFTFSALVRKWNLPLGPNIAQKIAFTLKITGTISFA